MSSQSQAFPKRKQLLSWTERGQRSGPGDKPSGLRFPEKHISPSVLPSPRPAQGPLQRLTLKLPGELFLAGIVFPIMRMVGRSQMRNASAWNKYYMNPETQAGPWEPPNEMPISPGRTAAPVHWQLPASLCSDQMYGAGPGPAVRLTERSVLARGTCLQAV